MNILFVSSEVTPFAKTGGLADVSGILPQALTHLGHKCSVMLPLYELVGKNGFKPSLFKSGIKLKLGPKSHSFNLYSLKQGNVDVYFIENNEYFERDNIYGTPQGDYPDNAVRFAFFSKAVLASIPYIGKFDILHLNDWQTALILLYLKLFYKNEPNLKNTKTLFSIHNLAYQGLFEKNVMPSIGIPDEYFDMNRLEYYGKISFIKSGILYSDAISTVSEGYAHEILTPEFGCGLEGVLNTRKNDLYGILNGVDYSVWNPETDKFIIKNYSNTDLTAKKDCKLDLMKEFGIKSDVKKPLIAMVTRLAWQKGVDIAADVLDDIIKLGANFILLGIGDEKYNNMFREIADSGKKSVGIKIYFSEILAHKIEAGADMFLIPSRYEPCGLNQMYSLKYGTVPIVSGVGGLDDTIEDFDPSTKKGNGFKFKEARTKALLEAVKRALKTYLDKPTWNKLIKNGMAMDFSWDHAAERYTQLYQKILSNK